jgi:hypothetical protein
MIASGVDVADVLLVANDPQTVALVDAPLEVVAETEIAAPVESETATASESGRTGRAGRDASHPGRGSPGC